MEQQRAPQEWGENTHRLWRGVAALGPWFIAARAATAAAQIWAGRRLGAQEFGVATLIIAASGVLFIPLTFGFPASLVKFASLETARDRRASIVSTGFWMQCGWGASVLAILGVCQAPLSRALRLDSSLFSWSLSYAGLLAFFTFVSTALQGVMLFDWRGKVECVYGAATLLLLLVALRFSTTFGTLIGAMDGALILGGIACVFRLRDFLTFSFDEALAAKMLHYSVPLFIAGCAGAIMQSAAPLILAARLSAREVGYFGAYTMGTLNVAMVFFQILNAVLAPLASDPARHEGAWRKFFALLIPLAASAFLSFCAAQLVILKLVGKGYPIVGPWIGLFSIMGVTYLLFFCAMSLLGVRDVENAWLGTAGVLITGVGCLWGTAWAIPRWGFPGSAVGLASGYAAGFAWCAYWGWKDFRRHAA